MELYLAHKVFEDVKTSYSFKEAKEKAFAFAKSLDDVEELGGDYWIQIAKEWDLNIWWEGDIFCKMTLYPCGIGEDGYHHTDTQYGIDLISREEMQHD